MKRLCAAAMILLTCLGAGSTAPAREAQKASGIRGVDFRNFAYRVSFDGPGDEKTVQLSDGKFEEGGRYEEGGMLYELAGEPAYGDLDGDGAEDAVVEIKRSGAPSLRSFEVHAYTFRDGGAKLLARLDDARVLKDYRRVYPKGELHYAGPEPPKVGNGRVTVGALVDGSFACPKYAAAFVYRVSGGKFVSSGRPTRRQFKCGG